MARSKVLVPLLILFSSPALAQVTELPEIVISAGLFPLESERVGASATVVSGEQLRAAGVATVGEALRRVPGLAVSTSGGRGALTEVRIRGAETNHLLVQIDGIEVNDAGQGAFDFADLPTDDVDRIEVIRGPQSGIYGANAHAGVVSIITRSGRGLARPRLDAKLEAGTLHSRAAGLNVRGSKGQTYGSLTVSTYATDGHNVSRFGSERDNSRATVVTAKGGIDLSEQFNVEGVVRHTERMNATDPQDFANFGAPTFGLLVDSPLNRNEFRGTAARGSATFKLLEGRWIHSVNLKLYNDTLQAFAPFLTFGSTSARTTFDYKSTLLHETDILGGERHTLTILAETRRQTFAQVGDPRSYHKDRIGLAGEYVLDLPTHTTLSGALRHDWNSAFADVLSWRAAISQRIPATGTRLHASAGKGVTEPTVFEVLGSPFNLPNPAILPEESLGWDAGVEQRWLGGRLVTDVTYFETLFTNKIDLRTQGLAFIYRNSPGTSPRRGVEVAVTWQILDWLTAAGVYTWLDARDSMGQPEIRRARHIASFDLTVATPDRRGRASIGFSHNSDRRDFFFGVFPTAVVSLPDATVVRAMLAYDVTPRKTVFVRAENLFDRRYEEVLSFRAPGFEAFAGLRMRLGEE